MNTAEAYLAVAFPPQRGYRGACTTIVDLSRHGLYSGHLGITPDKAAAVRLIVMVGLNSQRAHGHGNRALRRLKTKAATRRPKYEAVGAPFDEPL